MKGFTTSTTNFFIVLALIINFSCKDSTVLDKDEKTSNSETKTEKNHSLFELTKNKNTGVNFNNKLTHNLSTKSNLFDFDFFYNGSGVGIEDINNDGLKDIFFCGNQVPNRLYLNKGNLVFEDITEFSKINVQNKQWSNGVTFADVNNDGWMDIYISQGGPYNANKRKNTLLINQKDNTFKDMAPSYGLDDSSISTQSVFFDFDNDGDLDCVVMNESEHYGYDPVTFLDIHKNKNELHKNSSHFYKNINGTFKDITAQVGLMRPSFGLGICVTDINDDNLPDIYIANDYYLPDAMYINTGKGTFTNTIKEATKQISFYGMGVDIGDINNDNLDDIFVLDMASQDHVRSKTLMASMNVSKFELLDNLGFQTQYMFNSLQLNLGYNNYHNIGQSAGLSKTDWSWAGLIMDFDYDGWEDIYVSNGYRRYALDNDIKTEILKTKQQYRGNVPLNVKKTIYDKLPSEKLSNIFFKNKGNLSFENKTKLAGLDNASFSNGTAYGDLDNDGDLDIVVNNLDSEAFVYKNLTIENKENNYLKIIPKGNLSESFVKVSIHYNNNKKVKSSKRVRGYLSSVENSLFFGLGKAEKIDTVKVFWPSGKYQELYNVIANTTLTIKENEATILKDYKHNLQNPLFTNVNDVINFKHKENSFNDFEKEILLPYKQSTLGPFITKGDANDDGLEDLYIGGAHKQPGVLFLQHNDGTYQEIKNDAFLNDAAHEDMEALFIDIDNDNDNDLYVVSGGSEFNSNDKYLADRLYINNGKGQFTRNTESIINAFKFSGKTVSKIDYDKDGDEDLIVGNRIIPQQYPLHSPSFIFENENGQLKNVTKTICNDLAQFGIINKLITTDIDNDGWEDFIAVGEWTGIGIFKNENGIFRNISTLSNLDKETGWWLTVKETDINNDGLKDYVVGNVGDNLKYKVSNEKPLRVYANDFDENGTLDIVLSQKYKGFYVPTRGKECSTQQMPFISEKIPTYNAFANATLIDIYGEGIEEAYQKEAINLKSILLINKGNGVFTKTYLPPLAQTLPIIDISTLDLNADGFEDLVIVGNIYNTEVETPRLDNNYALILISDHLENYRIQNPKISNLYINSNAKSVEIINDILFVATNNNKVKTYKKN